MQIKYFVINKTTDTMHVYGLCPQTKSREIALRLFDRPEELEQHTGRKLRLCSVCEKKLSKG